VVVLGASGVIGRALLPELARSYEVVAVSRRPHPEEPGISWVQADVTDVGSLRGLLREGDVVVYLVHSLGTSDFERVDRLAAENVASAAQSLGVRRIVYLGGLGAGGEVDSKHLRSRDETASRLACGSVPVTTLRAAMVVGAGSAAFETIRALVDRLPAMLCPRWVSTPTQPIALRDVVRYLVGACGLELPGDESYDVGGPEVMTYREMIERIARIRGKRVRIFEVPVLTPRLSSWWLHLVTPVNAAVARPLIDGLRTPTVVRDERIRDLIPFSPTSFDDAVREALQAAPSGRAR
jgi:uncharacterized protein YbjT (DUF2867 family)